jgi:hypothetical protein
MLEFLRGQASGRKLRLFAVACCRKVLVPLDDERLLRAIQVVEDFADGETGKDELERARDAVCAVLDEAPNAHDAVSEAAYTAFFATSPDFGNPATLSKACDHAAESVAFTAEDCPEADAFAETWIRDQGEDRRSRESLAPAAYKAYRDYSLGQAYRQQCCWLRDLCGNPLRPMTINPVWLR